MSVACYLWRKFLEHVELKECSSYLIPKCQDFFCSILINIVLSFPLHSFTILLKTLSQPMHETVQIYLAFDKENT